MPFTLAHPAIVFPLIKTRKFSTTALVIGTMIPDFKFYLQLKENILTEDHGLGLIWFDLILAILLCYLFHRILKKPFLSNIPIQFSQEIKENLNFEWNFQYLSKNAIIVLTSALIGILSHIFWDAFTHHNGYFVQMIPFLSSSITILGHPVKIFFLLQIVFSAIGLAILAIYILKAKVVVGYSKPTTAMIHYWLVFSILYFLLLVARITFLAHYNSFWSLVIAFIGCLFYAWVLNSIIYIIKK